MSRKVAILRRNYLCCEARERHRLRLIIGGNGVVAPGSGIRRGVGSTERNNSSLLVGGNPDGTLVDKAVEPVDVADLYLQLRTSLRRRDVFRECRLGGCLDVVECCLEGRVLLGKERP